MPPTEQGSSARLAVVYPGDVRSARTWSGTPAGLTAGLEALGVRIEPIRAGLAPLAEGLITSVLTAAYLPRILAGDSRPAFRLSRKIATYYSPASNRLRSWAGGRALHQVAELDAIVQIGTGYTLPAIAPLATFEDMTMEQARRLGYPHWQAMSERTVGTLLAHQRRAYMQARACCAATRWAADSIVQHYGVPPEKVHVVGIGRNHDPAPASRDWTPPRFLFVGADWERKNGGTVLRAFADVRRAIPGATLDVVGGHPRIDLEGVTPHGPLSLDSPGEREQVELLFQRATCFVMPSLYEPVGIVYAEAAAAGIPSIGSAVGGGADVIGDAGRVVDPTDEEELRIAMLELADPDRAAALGALATRRAARFTWRAVAERLLAVLALPAPSGYARSSAPASGAAPMGRASPSRSTDG